MEWIKCSDRYPKDYHEVLFVVKFDFDEDKCFVEKGHRQSDNKAWVDTWLRKEYSNYEVSYWMQLPELPKEKPLVEVSEMIRKYPKALALKDPSKKCSGHDRAHNGEFYGELVNDKYKLCATCNDCMNDLINRDYKRGYYEKDNAWNAIVLGQEDIKYCAKRYRNWIAERCLKIKDQMAKMRDEMDKSRLKDELEDDGYTICMSFGADCFDTSCPKAKRLEQALPKEVIEIIKENL